MWPPFKSRYELSRAFPDEKSCIAYLEERRWKGKVVSPYDSTSKVYNFGNGKYRCANTKKFFNVKTGTIFEGTKLSLLKWFEAIWILYSHKKGISSTILAKEIGVTQSTAWRIMRLLREISKFENNWILDGEVELDETFVGGKNKNRHWDKKVPKSQGRSFKDKTPVLGMLQRGGKLVCKVVANTSFRKLTPPIIIHVKRTAKLNMDEWEGYKLVKSIYKYGVVNHKEKQYVNGDAHTNTIEGFWSILKRGIIGIYHRVSKKYLQLYVNEFVFRYNTRSMTDRERFDYFLENAFMNC